MNFDYTDDIEFPAFIINAETEKICFRNKAMEDIIFNNDLEAKECLLQVENIKNTVLKRLLDNDTVIFSYNALLEGIFYDLKIKSQYIESTREYIMVIIYIDMEYLLSIGLSVFTETVPGGLMIVGITSKKSYTAKYVNSGLLKMLGYTRQECEEYFSHDVLKFIHPDDIESGLKDFKRQIKERGVFNLNGRVIRKNGTILWVHFTGKLIKDIFGKEWLHCSVTDITQTQTLIDEMFEERQVYMVQKNYVRLRKKISRLILSYTHDLIWLIFANKDSYMVIEHMETTNENSTKISPNYEIFLNNAIEAYCKKEDWEYLKSCFSINNLKEKLENNDSYDFVGHGINPDGTPITKLHQFTYFDKEKGIILYSRKDVTNFLEQISFKINGIIYNFMYNEILFFESFGRKCELETISGSFIVNENITSIQNKLSGKLFIRCHRSYIINIKAITRLEKNYAILSNGKSVPINRQTLGIIKNKI